jgi:hypothetical protein
MRKALVIGIDDYQQNPLTGCVNDAIAVKSILEANGDGSPNFDVVALTSNDVMVSAEAMQEAIETLFSGDADMALLFFAGHGMINQQTNAGFILSQDGRRPHWGVSLSEILNLANNAQPRIKSSVIILDSCQSGFAGEPLGLGDTSFSAIANGVTILTACQRDGTAGEGGGHGIFTEILLEGLRGSAADICGRITPASVYSLIDQTLGAWDQRPIYKANVQTFVVLRSVTPKVSLEILRRLPKYFPDTTSIFSLDPSFEPDRGEEADKLIHVPVIENNVSVYRELQLCNRHGLVVPVDQPHMWHAAVHSTGCRLTALGAHYKRLAELKRI